MRSLVTDD